MTDTLRQRTWHAAYSKTIETLSSQILGFVVQMVLARMLLPEEFGLIGMLVVFIAGAEVFVNSGFAQALIQKQDADYEDECSVFWFNIVISVVAYYGARVIRYRLVSQFKDISPYVAMSVLMGALVYLLREWLEPLPDWGLLLVAIPMGVLLYAMLFFGLCLPARAEVVRMARDVLTRRPGET